MKKYFIHLIIVVICLLIYQNPVQSTNNLAEKLAGRILLQVENAGEAWYINPADFKRYYLGKPDDAFALMRGLGIGILNDDMEKIPIGLIDYNDQDSDEDGLTNRLEVAIGTDRDNADTDNDGYNDKLEIEQGYLATGTGSQPLDKDFAQSQVGKIFLQIKKFGEAWYVNPTDNRRYYLGRPADAFSIMKGFGLGITNANIEKIPISMALLDYLDQPASTSTPPGQICYDCDKHEAGKVFESAAAAIRTGNKKEAVKYFSPEMKKAIEYAMEFLGEEGNFNLGNIMAGAEPIESSDTKKTYATEVYFSLGGYKVPVKFYMEKQDDGTWLLANL